MVNFVYLCAGVILTVGSHFLFKYLNSFTALTVYEVPNDMLPIERDVLEEIANDLEPTSELRRNAYDTRRRMRMTLDSIQVRYRRILKNAARPKHWARTDWRIIQKNRLEYQPEVKEAINQVLEAERELRLLVVWALSWIWLWNISGFQNREWGPMPTIRRLRIPQVLKAYDKVKQATINLARSYGEAAIAEEIAAMM